MNLTLLDRIKGAGWAFVAASALGLATPAFAQKPGRPASKETVQSEPAVVKEAAPLSVDPARVHVEIAWVELAWCQHPLTFPLSLSVQGDGQGLTLRGFVPNQAVRQQAVQLARSCATLPVTDSLTVYPRLAIRSATISDAELVQGARYLLKEVLGPRHGLVQVEAAPRSQLVVKGSVANLDEKLAVSRCLRKLTGCSCVVNQLGIGPRTSPVAGQPRPSNPPPAKPAPVQTAAVKPAAPPRPPAAAPPMPPAAAPAPLPAVVADATLPPPPKPYPAAFVDSAPAAAKPPQVTAIEKVQYQEPAAPAAPPVKESKPEGIVKEYVVPPPPSAPPAEKPFVCSTIPDKPYTTTGVVFFGEGANVQTETSDSAQGPKPKQPLAVPAQQLQQKVQALCGGTIQWVQVRMQPDCSYKVEIRAADRAGAQAAAQLLSRIPELNAPNVQVHVSAGP